MPLRKAQGAALPPLLRTIIIQPAIAQMPVHFLVGKKHRDESGLCRGCELAVCVRAVGPSGSLICVMWLLPGQARSARPLSSLLGEAVLTMELPRQHAALSGNRLAPLPPVFAHSAFVTAAGAFCSCFCAHFGPYPGSGYPQFEVLGRLCTSTAVELLRISWASHP